MNFFIKNRTLLYLLFCSSFFFNFLWPYFSLANLWVSILWDVWTFLGEIMFDNFLKISLWFTGDNPHVWKPFSKFVPVIIQHAFTSLFKSIRKGSLSRFWAHDSFHQLVNSISILFSFAQKLWHQVVETNVCHWLRCWIPNAGVPCSKALGGSKVNSAFHPPKVGKVNTRNFRNLCFEKLAA